MAPKATGIREMDQENIVNLCYSVLRFAAQMSEQNAIILMKVWSNGHMATLEKDIKRFYKTVKLIKPNSSRSDSAEQFLLGRGFVGLEGS